MKTLRQGIVAIGVAVTTACAPPPPPLPPIPEPPPPLPAVVWTLAPETPVRSEGRRIAIEHAFTRLEVEERIGADSLRVRCEICRPAVQGAVSREQVAWEGGFPGVRDGGELGEFLAALRGAAESREMDALRPVMSRWFVYDIDRQHGVQEALRRWRAEGLRRLDRLPELLDRGVATADGELWVAPAEFATDPRYRGLRAGFEREDGRWRWVFFVGP